MFNFEHLLKCYSSAGQVLCNTYPQNVLLFRCVVRLNGLRHDCARRVAFLEVLTLRAYRPRHIATRHHHTRHNDCHKQ